MWPELKHWQGNGKWEPCEKVQRRRDIKEESHISRAVSECELVTLTEVQGAQEGGHLEKSVSDMLEVPMETSKQSLKRFGN